MKIDHPFHSDVPALRQLWQMTFGDSDAFLDLFFSNAYDPRRCLCLRKDANIVAAAHWLDCDIKGQTAAYIYAVAVSEAYRGQGFCKALMAQIHQTLAARNYGCSVLVPGDEGLRNMYAALGYRNFGGMEQQIHEASAPTAALRPIPQQEFAALRRQYLPENAIIQEGKTLDLLENVAVFYAGEDFVLTVSREEPKILELLGSTKEISGILLSLGMENATVRTPGTTPFAMHYPICSKKIPTYLGFALD